MKYTCTTEINLPISQVVELWKDENNFREWQDGFVKIEHISGKPETIGSQSRIYLEQGKQKLELLETITSNNLPHEKRAIYEHIHMTNTQITSFKSLGDNKTQYMSQVEYTKFNKIIPKVLSMLFPGMFRKQSQKWLDQFKEFAERKGGK